MGTEGQGFPLGYDKVPSEVGRIDLALEAVRRRSANLAWASVGLFVLGMFLPLSGEIPGLTALMFGWSGPTALAWSAAPLFIWSVGSIPFKKPGLVTATLAMLAFFTTAWFLPLLSKDRSIEAGFVVWIGCVVLNFSRAVYHWVAEHRLRLQSEVRTRPASAEGYVEYPRAHIAKGTTVKPSLSDGEGEEFSPSRKSASAANLPESPQSPVDDRTA